MKVRGLLGGTLAVLLVFALAPAAAPAYSRVELKSKFKLFVTGDSSRQRIEIWTLDEPEFFGDPVDVRIRDRRRVRIASGSDCTRRTARAVTCAVSPNVQIFSGLRGGADSLRLSFPNDGRELDYKSAVVNGHRGRDRLRGGEGEDELHGGPGADAVRTIGRRFDPDILRGGRGDDSLLGGTEGNETILGGPGDDLVRSGGSEFENQPIDDLLRGGRGDDRLSAGKGNDELTGGPGRDSISGGAGRDELHAEDRRRDRAVRCGSGLEDYAFIDRSEGGLHRGCETTATVFFAR